VAGHRAFNPRPAVKACGMSGAAADQAARGIGTRRDASAAAKPDVGLLRSGRGTSGTWSPIWGWSPHRLSVNPRTGAR